MAAGASAGDTRYVVAGDTDARAVESRRGRRDPSNLFLSLIVLDIKSV